MSLPRTIAHPVVERQVAAVAAETTIATAHPATQVTPTTCLPQTSAAMGNFHPTMATVIHVRETHALSAKAVIATAEATEIVMADAAREIWT